MKKGFKHTALYALALAFALNTSSCSDFLQVDPSGSVPEEEAYSHVVIVEKLVLGLYKDYRGCKAGRNGLMTNLGCDESQQGNFQLISSGDQAGMDKYNGQLNPTSQQVAAIWNNRWPAVVTAAKVVFAAKKTTEDPEKSAQLLGEASFLRGMLMFELSMYWGEIPIIDMDRTEELGFGPQPLKEVWTYIINDFTAATEGLPASYDNQPQRATAGAAWAMLGKAYMSAPEETGFRDFAKANDCFKEVVKLGRYDLLGNYADLFKYDKTNSQESLFELQFDPKWPNQNSWEFDCGSRACDSWFGQGCYFSGYDFLVPTPFAYKTTEEGGIWEKGDLRKDESLRYDFKYLTDKNLQNGEAGKEGVFNLVTPNLSKTQWTGTTDELDPHIKKFEDYRTDNHSGFGFNNMWNSGKNFSVIRFADVLLSQAECLNEMGQTAEAVQIVNDRIRTRAWGGELPENMKWSRGMSQDEFRDKVMDERVRELSFEGWRRIDLIRTNKFVKLVKERNKWAKESGTIQDFHKRYPIPETEIKTNEAFSPEDQNEGYTK